VEDATGNCLRDSEPGWRTAARDPEHADSRYCEGPAGAALTLCDVPGARGASWGEDGNIVVMLSSSTGIGLSRVSAAGGTPQTLTKPEASPVL
jgi:hypothetical protein